MIILIVVVSLLVIYLLTIIIFNKGLVKVFNSFNPETESIKISIVVAAKNEERNIEQLVSSIENQNYPKDFYELIIVDDNSKDTTSAKVRSLITEENNLSLYSVKDPSSPPKKGALQLGIEKARYDFILITDADCSPLPDWIRSFAGKFRDGYDFLFGLAPFHLKRNSDLNSFACFENLRSSLLTLSAAGSGFPFSASARSFGFKKESFFKIEGYKNTLNVVGGDDDLLIQQAVKNKMAIGTVTNIKALVYSDPPFTFREYAIQKKRHTRTSHKYFLKHKILLGYWHIINLAFTFSVLLIPFSVFFILPFLTKMISDYIIVKKRQSDFAYMFENFEIPLYQFLYELMIIFHFINSFTGKNKWR